MSLIRADHLQDLRIDKFIFHVVQHGAPSPILFDETPIGEFEEFFLDRVRETLLGNHFLFLPGSTTRADLKRIEKQPREFVRMSKKLAQAFHTRQDKRIKPGVLIVMTLQAKGQHYFSLLKYDHQQALTYAKTKDGTKAILKEIANSFTKSPEALHKSAFIELEREGGQLAVIDRTVRHDITEFFKGFLDVKRAYTSTELTKNTLDATLETVKAHAKELPQEITAHVRERFRTTLLNRKTFDSVQFFSEFFGPHGDEKIRATYDRQLRKSGLEGESFEFDEAAVQPSKPRQLKTVEGVRIIIEDQARNTVDFQEQASGGTKITITTQKYTELS